LKRRKKMNALKRFLRDEQGTETVEWAIIIGLIAVASIATIVSIGTWVSGKFTALDTSLAGN
jgi:pilus assembly protein Flp/PilA